MSLEQIQKDLDNLRAAVPELRGVLLASNEGRPIAHALPQESDPERLAALAALALSANAYLSADTTSNSEAIFLQGAPPMNSQMKPAPEAARLIGVTYRLVG